MASKYEPGKSGNPGGRPKIAKILAELGEDPKKIRKELFELAIKTVRGGPKGTNDASFRHQFDWLSAHLGLKPKETIVHEFGADGEGDERDMSDMTDAELDEIIAAAEEGAEAAPTEAGDDEDAAS